jgi:hypothetical protein
MIKEFLLHKDKENGNPPHIHAHLATSMHGRKLRSQKSIYFANLSDGQLTIREQLNTNLCHKKVTFV